MITFCIDEDKNRKLSTLLSDIICYFYQQEIVESVFINNYFIHKPMGLDFLEPSLEKDGINIFLNVVLKDGVDLYRYNYSEINELINQVLAETNINLIVQTSVVSHWTRVRIHGEYNPSDYILTDGEIIFDKNKTLIHKQNNLLFVESNFTNSVLFEPRLNLRKFDE